MPENRRATRLPSSSEARPLWARALDTFYGPSFDVRSRKELAESMADFLELPPGEQAFHQAHLAFRETQGHADVHQSLRRIEALLGGLGFSALAALKHLAPIRRALGDIADAQSEVLEALDEREDDEEDDEDDDELPPDADEDVLEDDEPAAAPPPPEVEVLVPEIVELPPEEPAASRKPRRPRVIDVPDAEAA